MVFKGINAFRSAHSRTHIEIENIESIFSAFEMAKLLGRLGSLSPDEIDTLTRAMKRLIAKTLGKTIKFPIDGLKILPPELYNDFAETVKNATSLNSHNGLGKISIITFNYDICLDYAFHWWNIPVDYCLENGKRGLGLKLLKLHGSLNWLHCLKCQTVIPCHISDFAKNIHTRFNPGTISDTKISMDLLLSSMIGSFTHCDDISTNETMIVPPTWNKWLYHEQLALVWRAAATELTDAENILICGYSLPPTDQFFRYLYALGTIGEARLKRFWVFNPDNSIDERFKALLGPEAKSRFKFYPIAFREAITIFRSVLDITGNSSNALTIY